MTCQWIFAGALSLFLILPQGCARPGEKSWSTTSADLRPALDSIAPADLLNHTKVLSSDEFEGRAPGTRGEELTVGYLVDQFRKIGLQPGNPDGTYVQDVPLVGITGIPQGSFAAGGRRLELKFPSDYVAVSRRTQPEVRVTECPLVFVGYGVAAPEFGWDDYKGADVSGKALLMLINDPPVPDPADPTKLDEKMFKGKAMTYYGRWTYKYEIASEKGAAAAIIIHETGPAGYPYEVVESSWGRENFDIKTEGTNEKRVAVESWIGHDAANRLLRLCGQDLAALKAAANSRNFKPIPLNVRASFTVRNKIRDIQSRNVIGRIEGSDPALRDQHVIYSAHWDHLGKDENLKGDQIFNGALDNASGTAALIELAQAFKQLPRPSRRSMLFMSFTSEEQGLLGARFYTEKPLYPLSRTAAIINMDGVNPWGPTRDIAVVGLGNSTLDDILRGEAESRGRTVTPDPEPEKGSFYRSDHFEFAKQGVPALYVQTGTEFLGKSPGYAKHKRDEYVERDYHKVTDEVKPDWDLSGTVEDLKLLFLTGFRVAQDDAMPIWLPGTEFKAKREQMPGGH